MSKLTVYHRMHVRPPDGQCNPYAYSESLFADYGWRKMQFVFSQKGENNLDKEFLFEQIKAVPPCSLVEINLEGKEWVVIDGNTATVRPIVVENLVSLIGECRKIRPDCIYGYYAKVPTSRQCYEIGNVHLAESCDRALRPLADAVDALFPEFYLQQPLAVEDAEKWIFQTLNRAKRLYPGKRIVPHLWPCWYSWWLNNKGCERWPLDKWTPEVLAAAYIPGEYWARMLRVIVECGVSEVMLWGQELEPWTKPDWFVQMRNF